MARLLTRMDCARFGALVWIGGLIAWCAVSCFIALVFKPGREMEIVRAFYVAIGVALIYGPLAGVVRYQMKRGTPNEQKGGGGCAQVAFAMPLMLILLPVMIFPGLLLAVVSQVFKKDLWKDGTSGWIAPSVAIAWLMLVFLSGRAPDLIWRVALVGAICSSDFYLAWQIFEWDAQGRLASPSSAELPRQFFLSELLVAVLILGAYMSGLVFLFREN